MSAAFLVAWLIGRPSRQRLPVEPWQQRRIAAGALLGAVLGAKLPYLLANAERLSLGFFFLSTQKTILGGLVGGYLGVEAAKWSLGVRVKTGDSFAVPVAAAIAVGRLGCFVGGCCYGLPTTLPWGVDFGDGIPRHPTQLYEFAFHAAAAAALWECRRRGLFPRQLIKLYILTYLGYRFASDFLRPEATVWMSLTGYQLATVALVPLFAGLWMADRQPPNLTPIAPNL
ncbi:MAG: prolipoprotein diacylglyceryl transferase [Candidatus Wallbacteria bacterium]|nr:prolipoprotein diacylglyceryl transferase [Candidatus Wallbacteria bacterium]